MFYIPIGHTKGQLSGLRGHSLYPQSLKEEKEEDYLVLTERLYTYSRAPPLIETRTLVFEKFGTDNSLLVYSQKDKERNGEEANKAEKEGMMKLAKSLRKENPIRRVSARNEASSRDFETDSTANYTPFDAVALVLYPKTARLMAFSNELQRY